MMIDTKEYIKRIKQLEDAIKKHKETFIDEALCGEYELWSVLWDDK